MEVARAHDAFGTTYVDLAKQHGVSERTVREWAKHGRELIIADLRSRGQDQTSQLLRDLARREARVEHLVRMALTLEGVACPDDECAHTSKKCTAVRSHSLALGYWAQAARLEEDLSKLRKQYTEKIELSGQVQVTVESGVSPEVLEALRARAGD